MSDTNTITWQFRCAGVHNVCTCGQSEADPAPPDGYARGLAARKAAKASSTLEAFEKRWKRERLRELEPEHVRIFADLAARPTPRLTAAEAAEYAAPDPYERDLVRLRERQR